MLLSMGPMLLHAQTPRLGFEHLTMEQGLPSNHVFDILFDHKGYLWACTGNGLSRYDGYNFTNYQFDPKDAGSLNDNLDFTLFEDDEGSIWVSTAEGGINKFNRNTEKFTNYRPPQPPGRFETVLRAVSAIAEDKQGYLWVGSYSGELRRFDKRTGKFSPFDYDLGYRVQPGDYHPFDRVNTIYCDSHGDIWAGNLSGLHQLTISPGKPFDPANVRIRNYVHDPRDSNSISGREVVGICEDHAGRLWVSTDSELDLLDRNTGHFKHYALNRHMGNAHNGFFGNIIEDQEHHLWLGSDNGIDRLDTAHTHFDHFEHIPGDPNSLNKFNGYHLAADKGGNIWITGAGIDKLDPRQVPLAWYHLDRNDPRHPADNYVGGICQDHTGTIWIATDSCLEAQDKATGKTRRYRHDPNDPNSLADNMTSAVLEDPDGMIWVSCWKGMLDRLDPRTGRFTHYIGPRGKFRNLEPHWYYKIYQDPKGIIWIAESSSGVTELDYKNGKLTHFGHDPNDPGGISDWVATAICADDEGYLWIGHGSVATDRLDPRTGRCQHFQFHFGDSAGISSNLINAIFNDHHGSLWFGTHGGGLCRYDEATGKFTTYTEKNGLLDNNITSILAGKLGNLWLGTNKGICRFSPKQHQFTNLDYLNPSSDQSVNLFCIGRDGLIYFKDADEGFKSFDPASLHPNRYIPPIVITRFNLFDWARPIEGDSGTVRLGHDQNFFSFEFSALNYTASRRNQYAYMLEGFDKEWNYSCTRRIAAYTNVPPGTYTFRVKGSNNDGRWNNAGIALKVVISPPWWRNIWALTLYGLVAVAAFVFIDRTRKRRLVEKERQRSLANDLEMQALRAQMNPHFIFNSLTSINRFILKSDTLAASDYLTRFSRLIRLVLNNSKRSFISLEDELEMLRLYLDMEMLRFKDAFIYSIRIGEGIDAAAAFIPPMLIQPFVENAVWHGLMHKQGLGKLDIQIENDNDLLVITITDNGVGRSHECVSTSKSAQKRKSMGIDITKKRLSLVNGAQDTDGLTIVDLFNQQGNPCGTRVIIKIKAGAAVVEEVLT
ncbi:MAG TPA: two-component regulator propeller domain-containing protein [Puia sp.]|nr:two-component regulator propeller domain-containing protein [Puia sp.]